MLHDAVLHLLFPMSRYSTLHPYCEMPYFVSKKQHRTCSAHQLSDLSCIITQYACLSVTRYILSC